ncbi:ubiquinone biosynthesis protein COQ9, mitochondrial, partial [Elysia marginata]
VRRRQARFISVTAAKFTAEQRSEGQSSENSAKEDAQEAQYEHDIRQRILSASLVYVQELGWTQKALEAGAKDEGLPPIAHGMFPRGGAELVHYFYSKSNEELAEILSADVKEAEAKGEKLKTQTFIQNAIETRLRMIFPYMDIWPQAMAIQALPQNAVDSWTNTLNLMDEIWYYAGDRSTDFNWYTKRMTLFAIYKSTEVYMLQDKSADKEDTWAFLNRRLKDLENIAAAKKSCEQNSDVFKEAVKGFAVMGRNVLGFNSRDR